MKKEYIITFAGQEHVKYAGLLDEAHQQGLKRISTTIIQIPHQDNGNMAIVTAEVETTKGVFAGIGDASPGNVNRMIVPHILRQAETRAKARALRDAVNVGEAAIEEMGDIESEEHIQSSAPPSVNRAAPHDANISDFPKASSSKRASANQMATVVKLSRLLGHPEEPTEDMTSAEISERITELSREYNERKGAGRRA